MESGRELRDVHIFTFNFFSFRLFGSNNYLLIFNDLFFFKEFSFIFIFKQFFTIFNGIKLYSEIYSNGEKTN